MGRKEIIDDIRGHIASGRWLPGHLLPSRAELAKTYGVSTATVQTVFVVLKETGEIETQPGVGVYVAAKRKK